MNVTAGALPFEEPGKVPSAVLALLVHVLLAVFLFFGVQWQSRQPESVMVELWTSLPAPVTPQITPAPEPTPEPKVDIRPEPKVEQAIEPPKPDIALEKKKEIKKEAPKKAEPKPVKPEPKPIKPEPKPEPKPKPDRDKEIRAQADREIADVRKTLDKESILNQISRDAATATARADATYIGKLIGAIRSNIVLPPDIPGNPEAIFDVVQLPTGEVMSVKLRKSSGHKAYDAAVERAIFKSSPLPKDQPERFKRSLEIKFRPLD